jgi:hypothetical protein
MIAKGEVSSPGTLIFETDAAFRDPFGNSFRVAHRVPARA